VNGTTDTHALTREIARRNAPEARRELFALMEHETANLAKLLGSDALAEQFKTAAYSDWKLRPDILECDPHSLVGGVRLAAQLGLQFGPLGHVYLVPRKTKGGGKWATFVLGYKGKVELAYRSGLVKRIEAHIVREGDEFSFEYGTAAKLRHVPNGPPGARAWVAVYAVAELKAGGKVFTVLYPEDVDARRKRSAAADSAVSPWQTDTAQMWRKSAVHDLQKFLPQTPAVALATEADERPAPSADASVTEPDS